VPSYQAVLRTDAIESVLPTYHFFQPNQPKNSAADEKTRPLTLSFDKGFFTNTSTSRKLIHNFKRIIHFLKVRPLLVKSTKN
jgi:hypothetical protein